MRTAMGTTLLGATTAAVALVPLNSVAQAYPARTVRVICAAPASGLVDVVGRIVFQKIAENTGQQFVIDNRPGAIGVIGAEMVARAPADGYTLLLHSASHIASPHIVKKLPYDAFKDFTPISLLAAQTGLITAHPSLPVKTIKELVALAKARPGQLMYASSGSGSFSHLAMALIDTMTGTKMVNVNYKGGAPATTAVASGETQLIAGTPAALLTHLTSNRLRLMAVTSDVRLAQFPQTPTVAESGIPGYEFRGWVATWGPASLPRAIVERMNAEVLKSIESPDTKKRMEVLEPWTMTPEQTTARMRADYEKYGRIIKMVGIAAD